MAVSPEERQAQTALRDVGTPLQWIWLVDPDGYPKRVPTASNINNGHTFVDDSRRTRLLGVREEEGWKFMQRVVTPEEWAIWIDYHRTSDAQRGRIKPLADHLWPKGIKNPRSRNRVDGKADYTPAAKLGAPEAPAKTDGSSETADSKPEPAPPSSQGAPADPAATTRRSTQRG
jgi:hypothetical protein